MGSRTRRTRHWHCRHQIISHEQDIPKSHEVQKKEDNEVGVDLHNGMACIVSASGTGADARLLAEDVAELPLTLVTCNGRSANPEVSKTTNKTT